VELTFRTRHRDECNIHASNVYNTVPFLLDVRRVQIVAEATHATSQPDSAADLEYLVPLPPRPSAGGACPCRICCSQSAARSLSSVCCKKEALLTSVIIRERSYRLSIECNGSVTKSLFQLYATLPVANFYCLLRDIVKRTKRIVRLLANTFENHAKRTEDLGKNAEPSLLVGFNSTCIDNLSLSLPSLDLIIFASTLLPSRSRCACCERAASVRNV